MHLPSRAIIAFCSLWNHQPHKNQSVWGRHWPVLGQLKSFGIIWKVWESHSSLIKEIITCKFVYIFIILENSTPLLPVHYQSHFLLICFCYSFWQKIFIVIWICISWILIRLNFISYVYWSFDFLFLWISCSYSLYVFYIGMLFFLLITRSSLEFMNFNLLLALYVKFLQSQNKRLHI